VTVRRSALLMLDYQVALCGEPPYLRMPALAEQVAERKVLETAASVLSAARSGGWPVFHVRLAFDPSYALRTNRLARFDPYEQQRAMLASSPEAQIVDQVAPIAGEPVIDKGCVDPFVGTPLLAALTAAGVGHIVLGGVATNLVVESAARHASDSGLQVSVVEDMCASFRADFHSFSIENMLPLFSTVITSADLIPTIDPIERHAQ
jgi:nicotinamidase-related amidase